MCCLYLAVCVSGTVLVPSVYSFQQLGQMLFLSASQNHLVPFANHQLKQKKGAQRSSIHILSFKPETNIFGFIRQNVNLQTSMFLLTKSFCFFLLGEVAQRLPSSCSPPASPPRTSEDSIQPSDFLSAVRHAAFYITKGKY